jgi:hypothetical protein
VQETLLALSEGFVVDHGTGSGAQVSDHVSSRVRVAPYAGMLRFDLHVAHHDVRRERVVSEDELSAVQKVEIPEPRPL